MNHHIETKVRAKHGIEHALQSREAGKVGRVADIIRAGPESSGDKHSR